MRHLFRQWVSKGADRHEASPRTRSEAGDTLVEVLLALLVLSLASVALILAFSTSISASAEHRRLVTADLVVGSVSQNAIANIEGQLQLFACSTVQSGQSTPVTTTTYLSMVQGLNFALVPAQYSNTYTASITGVEWWNGTAFTSTCDAGDPEEITVTVTNTSTGVTYVNTFVVSFPLTTTNSVSGSAPGTSLIFSTQPSDSSTQNGVTTYGEAGAALITQPVVEVLDAANDPVSTDYSPAILSIASGPAGGVLTGCVGNESVGGIVSFSGCTLSLQGTYTLIATDGSLTSAPSSPITVGALGDYLAFATNHQPVAAQSGSAFSTEPVVEVLTATGTVDQSWVGTITLTASGGDLASSCSGTITAANDGVWTAPSSCTFAGAITDNPSNGNINAAPYTMTANGSSTNSPVIPVVPVTSNPFSVTSPGPPTQLVFTTQPTGAAGTGAAHQFASFSVTMEDAFGNIAYTSTNTIDLAISTGTLGGCSSGAITTTPTDDYGVATFTGCYGSATGNNLTLTATAVTGSLTPATSQPFNITGVAYALVFTRQPVANASGQTLLTQPQVTIEDANGNVVTSSTAVITLTPSGGTLSYCTSLNAVSGVVNVTGCTFAGLVGTQYTMTATSGSLLPATSSSFSPTGPGVPTQIAFTTEPVAGLAGSPFTTPPVVSLEDSGGNVVTTAFSTATFAASGGTLNCPEYTIQIVDGVGDLDGCTFGGVVGTNYQLTVSSPNLTQPTSNPGTATSTNFSPTGPGPAAEVAITSTSTPNPPTASSTANVTLTLQLEDAWGNHTTSASATQFSLTSTSTKGFFAGALGNSGTLGAAGAVTIPANNTGIGTGYYGDENAGQPIVGAENVAAAAEWGSEQLNIVPAAPSQVALTTTCPTSLASGGTCTVTATVEDQFGNPETTGGAGVVFAEGVGDVGSLTLSGQTSSGGSSTVTVTGQRVGAVTVNTTTPFAAATPVSFTVTVGSASKIAISAGANQSATVGTAFTNPLSALVTDAYGNPVSGAVVTFTAPASGASGTFLAASNGGTCLATGGTAVASCTAVTGVNGIASSLTYTANDTAGSYNVAVTSPATTPNPLNFAETNTPALPSKVVFTTEPPATGTAGTALTTFKVSVEDQFGNTVTTGAGSTDGITLSIHTGPAGGVFNSAAGTYTNVAAVAGVATFSGVYFDTPGSYTLTATDTTRILTTATSNPATAISAAAPNKVIFTVEPPATTTAGATLASFAVSVEDQYGNVITAGTGATDTIALTSTCTLTGTDSVAAIGGVATFNAVTITKGTICTLTATDSSRTITTATSNPATTVTPAAANKVAFTVEPPTTTTAGATLASFAVSVEDQYGNLIATGTGSTDTIALTSTCTLGGTDSATATGGVATFNAVTINKGTTCTLTATDSSRTLTTATSNPATTVTAAAANNVVFTVEPPATATAGATLASFAVSVEDTYGNVVTTGAGATDTIALTSGCTLGGTDSVAAVGGVATFTNVDITSVGSCTLTATDSTRTVTTATSSPATVVSPAAAKKVVFTVEPPASTTAGATLASFAVSVEDQYGNLITTGTGSTDTIALTSSCTLTGTDSVAAVGGVATFNAVTITKGTICTLTATDSSRTLTTATSNPATVVTPAGASKVVFTVEPPATATAGTALTSFAVSVEDQYGNLIATGTGSTDTIALTSSCTLGGTDTATATGGVATFNAVTITSVGSCTLTATDSSRTLATANSAPATVVSPAAANKVVFTVEPPATATAGTALTSFAVSVEDQFGNVVTTGIGSTDTIALTSSCTLGGTDSVVAVGGVATFNAATINSSGSCTLTATDSSRTLTTATSNPATVVSPAGASKVVFTVEPPATATAGTALTSFAVSVEDQYGNLITTGTGSTDTIAITSSCTLTGTESVAAVGGVATFNAVTITKGTTCTLTATDSSRTLTTANSSPATTVTAAAANKVVFTVEPPATAAAGTALTSFAVSVEDQYGNVVTTGTGSTDTVALTSACTLVGTDSVVAVGGVATFNAVTITSVGSCTLTATDSSRTLTTATSSPATVVSPGPANKVAFTTEPPATTTAGATLTTFRVSVEDSSGNVITTGTGSTDTITLTSSCTLGGTDSVAAVAGVATFSAATINTGTTCTLTATDSTRVLATATSAPATTVTATTASKVAFTIEPPATGTAGTALTSFAVSVEDQYGNVVTSGTGSVDTIALTSTCTLTGTDSVTAVAGVATFSAVTITSTGSCTLTATDSSRTLTTANSSPATVISPAAANKVIFTTEPPATGTAGTALTTFVVSVEDQYGNVVTTGTGSTDSITLTSSCGLGGTNPVTAVGGQATFANVDFTSVGSCTLTATDSSRTLTTATSSPATVVSPGPANKVAFTTEPPATTTAGATLTTFRVSVEDSSGNVITTGTGSTDTITLTSSCTLGGTDSVAAVAGVATFSAATINTGTTCTLTATDSTRVLATATSAPATTVTATTASKVAFTIEPPATGTAGTALTSFAVSVEDQYGNVVTSGTGSVDTIALTSACTLTGTDSVTAVAGVATFSAVTITKGTSCTLTATDSSRTLTTANSSPATVISPAALNKVIFTVEPSATATRNVTLASFAVSVEDTYGNVETTGNTGATDTIRLTANGGCTLGGTTSVAAANGVATFANLRFTSDGTCTLTATDFTHTITTATSSPSTVVTG